MSFPRTRSSTKVPSAHRPAYATPERAILRSPMGPSDGQSWRARSKTSGVTAGEAGRRRKPTVANADDEYVFDGTPRPSAAPTQSAFTTPGLSFAATPTSSTLSNTTSYGPETPTHSLLGQRRRTHSALPFKSPSSTPPPGAWNASTGSAFDQAVYEESSSFFSQRLSQIYQDTASPVPVEDEGGDECLLITEADNQQARRGRHATEGFPAYTDVDVDEDDSCGKTLTPSTPALPHTPKSPPPTQDHAPKTPDRKPYLAPIGTFFTPPPPSSRRIVPTLPVAPASAPRNRRSQVESPFKQRSPFGLVEPDELEEDDIYASPSTPERRNAGLVQGESPPSPPKLQGTWTRKLSGLSPAQRETREPGIATAASMSALGGKIAQGQATRTPKRGRIVTFGDEAGGSELLIARQVDREREKAKKEKPCGSCGSMVAEGGVKVDPCGCFVCGVCFTSGMNVVCDIAGGLMRCPSCTTLVQDFTKFNPVLAKTPSPPPAPVPEWLRGVNAAQAGDSQPAVLRFDNASWDVTPDMIVGFLPADTLPDAADNPHPIHLLIDPISGKTKDYLFVEVRSKKAAALVIKTVQGHILGEGKRARRVTITISNDLELRREIQPTSPRTLSGLLELCQAAFSNRKTYIKRRSFPFMYLLTVLTKADLQGLETDILLAFRGATSILSNFLESGANPPEITQLVATMYDVLSKNDLVSPVVGEPNTRPLLDVMPGVSHPINLYQPSPLLAPLLWNPAVAAYYGLGVGAMGSGVGVSVGGGTGMGWNLGLRV